MSKYDYYKLYNESSEEYPKFVVKGFKPYPRSSVNYGMTMICFLNSFESEAEAREAYPDLPSDGTEFSNKFMEPSRDPGPIAPSWFDPSIAGERWDDDY